MKAITTRYSNRTRQYVARDGDGNTVRIDPPEQYETAHRDAAVALIRKMGWAPVVIATGWACGGETVHVMLPSMPEGERLLLAQLGRGVLYHVEVL